MSSKQRALIFGITGQDGSYLSEMLHKQGYEVHGVARRSSVDTTGRIRHLLPHIYMHVGDITDAGCVSRLIEDVVPHEIYNFAAMSHVAVSFLNPSSTFEINTQGCLNILNAMKESSNKSKLVHSSTSEMFGSNYTIAYGGEKYQDEETPFNPQSPYAISKLAAHKLVELYRNSYGLYACSTIMFNHECIFANTPIITAGSPNGDFIDIKYIRDLMPERKNISKDNNVLTRDWCDKNEYVWNGIEFVKILTVTRRKLNTLQENDRAQEHTNTRNGVVCTTQNHKFILVDGSKRRCDLVKIDKSRLAHGHFPDQSKDIVEMTHTESKLLGYLVGDGYVGSNKLRLINKDETILMDFVDCCTKLYGISSYSISEHKSGYGGLTKYVDVSVSSNVCSVLREQVYHTRTKHKKVPVRILNSSEDIQEVFFDAYYICDGLKQQGRCIYKYMSFKTNSPLLAQGLLYLLSRITHQTYNINVFEQNKKVYYQVNLHSDREVNSNPKLDSYIVKKKLKHPDQENCFVYDIETECGFLNAGVGTVVIGNSPRRGNHFVTRKISRYVAALYNVVCGYVDEEIFDSENMEVEHGGTSLPKLRIGNLKAFRDWGHARDFVKASQKMLQQTGIPKDYVVCTGETNSVQNFADTAFSIVGYDSKKYMMVDPLFYRPSEVEYLKGSNARITRDLGWQPEIAFDELVHEMVENDIVDFNCRYGKGQYTPSSSTEHCNKRLHHAS